MGENRRGEGSWKVEKEEKNMLDILFHRIKFTSPKLYVTKNKGCNKVDLSAQTVLLRLYDHSN